MQNMELVPGDIYGNHGGWLNEKHLIGSDDHYKLWHARIEDMGLTPSFFLYGAIYKVCGVCLGDCKLETLTDNKIITTTCKFCTGMGTFKDYYANQPRDTMQKLQLQLLAAIELVSSLHNSYKAEMGV